MWIWFVRSGMISAWFQCGLKMKFQPLACWNIWPSTSAPGKTCWALKSVFSNQLFSEPIISPKWSFKPWHYGLTDFHTGFKINKYIYIYWEEKKKALTVFLGALTNPKKPKPIANPSLPWLLLFFGSLLLAELSLEALFTDCWLRNHLKRAAKPSPYVPLKN
jgi:hypothetical protein